MAGRTSLPDGIGQVQTSSKAPHTGHTGKPVRYISPPYFWILDDRGIAMPFLPPWRERWLQMGITIVSLVLAAGTWRALILASRNVRLSVLQQLGPWISPLEVSGWFFFLVAYVVLYILLTWLVWAYLRR
jgi:hypothetical protein